MDIDKLNPFIRYAKMLRSIEPRECNCTCYDCRLFYIDGGNGFIRINDENYSVSRNTVIFLPSGTNYRFHYEDWSDMQMLVVDFDLTDEYFEYEDSLHTAVNNQVDPAKFKHTSEIRSFCKPLILCECTHIRNNLINCADKFLTKEPYYRQYSSAMLKYCLIKIIDNISTDSNTGKIVANVLEYIHNNYSDISMTNQTIADNFSYHPFYLNTIIKSVTGKTLHQCISNYRINIAENLLTTTDYKIVEIAWKSGFSSVSYFIKVFREQTGLTPKKYKKANMLQSF